MYAVVAMDADTDILVLVDIICALIKAGTANPAYKKEQPNTIQLVDLVALVAVVDRIDRRTRAAVLAVATP